MPLAYTNIHKHTHTCLQSTTAGALPIDQVCPWLTAMCFWPWALTLSLKKETDDYRKLVQEDVGLNDQNSQQSKGDKCTHVLTEPEALPMESFDGKTQIKSGIN